MVDDDRRDTSAKAAACVVGVRLLARNTDDDSLRALANRGGVAGIYFMPFLRASGQPHAEGRFLVLADDLAKRGWSTGRIEKILGANFARLFSEVWG